MQQGRNSSGGQGVPDRAAEEQATTRGRKRVRKAFQGRNSLSPLFAFSVWAVLHSGAFVRFGGLVGSLSAALARGALAAPGYTQCGILNLDAAHPACI
jgi:hypothetical protein